MRTSVALIALCGPCMVPIEAVTWSSGSAARSDMETIIKAHAHAIQSKADYLLDLDEIGSCPAQKMCDANPVWADEAVIDPSYLAMHPRFNDPQTGTCVAIDLNEDGNILQTPVTGRTTLTTSKTACKYSAVKETFSGFELETESKQDALASQGCVDNSDISKCITNIDPDVYTYIMPTDASFSVNDDRPRAEICATNNLVDNIDYSFKDIYNDYTQTGWTWLGMQETGLYRTWPSMYQCRTENQCSGCSDPRYRSWYASAAAGSKDVIIVIDTSGSMTRRPYTFGCTECSPTKNRMDYVKEAASWVINTLSEADYAMVVEFSGDAATSKSSVMLPMNMVNRAILKDYIADLQPDGNTPMAAAFEKAFEVIQDSTIAGASSGCTKNILFLTDGVNSGSDQSVIDIIRAKNGGPYENEDLHYESGSGQNGDLTLISTYAFGDGASNLMSQIACENGGVYHNIPDNDAKHLKEVMANYYTYMAAGMVPPDAGSDPVVRWADIYEDGQGRGQVTGACSPVYSFHSSPAQLIGVTCLGASIPVLSGLSDWDVEWADIQNNQGFCYDVLLTWEELETLRAKKVGTKQYTRTCEAAPHNEKEETDVGTIAGLIGAVAGFALLVVCCRTLMSSRSGSSDKDDSRPSQSTTIVIQQPSAPNQYGYQQSQAAGVQMLDMRNPHQAPPQVLNAQPVQAMAVANAPPPYSTQM